MTLYFDVYCREKRKWKPPKSKSSKIELSDALGIHQQKGSKATSKLSHKKAKYDKNIGDDNTDMGLLTNDEELALQLLSRWCHCDIQRQYQYAKAVDSTIASEANKKISNYKDFIPSLEDGFQRGIKEGKTLKVNCWIGEKVKVRYQ